MAEMEQAQEEEWSRKLAITFVGEDGVDAGGLSREFFFYIIGTISSL
jgi:hypothetical protein